MYNIDFRRDGTSSETAQSAAEPQKGAATDAKQFRPGSLPFDETDAGKNGDLPF